MSLLALIVNRIAYTIEKTAAGIKDQCCNCHANLSPAGRIIHGTITMAQHTSAEMPKILRIITDFDLWDSFMPLNLSGGKNSIFQKLEHELSGHNSSIVFVHINKYYGSFGQII